MYCTYLLDDGRDVAGVLLHGLGVLVVLEGRHGGAARSPAPRSHTLICRAALFVQEVLSTMGGCLGYFVWLGYRPRGVDASAHFGRRRARRPAAMQSRNF